MRRYPVTWCYFRLQTQTAGKRVVFSGHIYYNDIKFIKIFLMSSRFPRFEKGGRYANGLLYREKLSETRIFTFKKKQTLFSFQMLYFSCYEYLPRFLNFTMVYNLFIFISVFLLPEIPENRGWTIYHCERNSAADFFFFLLDSLSLWTDVFFF